MGRVPEYGSQKVAQRPFPAARVSTGVDPNAFGAGFGKALDEIREDERKKADETAVQSAITDIRERATSLMYDPEIGFTYKAGESAFAAGQAVPDEFSSFIASRLDALSNGDQKQAAQILAERERLSLERQLAVHVGRERVKFRVDTLESGMESSLERIGRMAVEGGLIRYNENAAPSVEDPNVTVPAGLDASAIEQEISIGIGQLRAFAQANPELVRLKSSTWLKDEIEQYRSDAHRNVVRSMLAKGRDMDAEAYFKKYEGEILTDVRNELDRSVRDGSRIGSAMRVADESTRKFPVVIGNDARDWFEDHGLDYQTPAQARASALAWARAQFPDDIRAQEQAASEVHRRFDEIEKMSELQQLDIFNTIYDDLRDTGDIKAARTNPDRGLLSAEQDALLSELEYEHTEAESRAERARLLSMAYATADVFIAQGMDPVAAEAAAAAVRQEFNDMDMRRNPKLTEKDRDDLIERKESNVAGSQTVRQIIMGRVTQLASTKGMPLAEALREPDAQGFINEADELERMMRDRQGHADPLKFAAELDKLFSTKVLEDEDLIDPDDYIRLVDIAEVPLWATSAIYDTLLDDGREPWQITDDVIIEEYQARYGARHGSLRLRVRPPIPPAKPGTPRWMKEHQSGLMHFDL